VCLLDQRLVVAPRLRHGPQRSTFQQVGISGPESVSEITWSRDEFANVVAHVRVPEVANSVEFHVDAVIERSGRALVAVAGSALADGRYLLPTALTRAGDAIGAAAQDLAAGPRSGIALAERLCEHVHSSVAYRKGATGVATTADEAFAIGAGVCHDHAHVMLAMCRSVGLPARYVSGHLLGEGATHAWVEVLLPHPTRPNAAVAEAFDPCHGRRPGATYVTVAVGRDYRDVAPTSGTYVGRVPGRLTSSTSLRVSILDAATGGPPPD
jgi:transglutaminase-like putative cysteine protease